MTKKAFKAISNWYTDCVEDEAVRTSRQVLMGFGDDRRSHLVKLAAQLELAFAKDLMVGLADYQPGHCAQFRIHLVCNRW